MSMKSVLMKFVNDVIILISFGLSALPANAYEVDTHARITAHAFSKSVLVDTIGGRNLVALGLAKGRKASAASRTLLNYDRQSLLRPKRRRCKATVRHLV